MDVGGYNELLLRRARFGRLFDETGAGGERAGLWSWRSREEVPAVVVEVVLPPASCPTFEQKTVDRVQPNRVSVGLDHGQKQVAPPQPRSRRAAERDVRCCSLVNTPICESWMESARKRP